MTKKLPDSANLEWLKKSAKQLYRSWRKDGKEGKLADAQFALATEYGFSSWRELKAHFDNRELSEGDRSADNARIFLQYVGAGNLEVVRSMLAQQPSLINAIADHPFWKGRAQPLHIAIETNQEELFHFLLQSGADFNGSNAEYDHWSPLMVATAKKRERMVTVLLKNGAAVNLCEALLLGNDAAVDRCLTDNAEVPKPSGSLLALARTPYAIKRLLDLGVSPHPRDRWGADALEALSRLGADGKPLIEALKSGGISPRTVELARMGDQETLIKLAQKEPSFFQQDEVFLGAVDAGHIRIARWLLENGANVNARAPKDSYATALHFAAWNGDRDMAKCLLEFGGDRNIRDREHDSTPAGWAEASRVITNNPACEAVGALLNSSEE